MKHLLFLSVFIFFTQLSIAQAPVYDWGKTLNSYHSAIPNGANGKVIATDAKNNVYVCGTYARVIDLDPGANVDSFNDNLNAYNCFLAKYTPDGDYVWGRVIHGATGEAIALDSTGNIYIGGSFIGQVDFDPGSGTSVLNSNGNFDFFIAKFSSDGDYLWERGTGGTLGDMVHSIAIDNYGDVIAGGYFYGYVDFDEQNPGSQVFSTTQRDGFVAKYSSGGQLIWANHIHGENGDAVTTVKVNAANEILASGYTSGCRFVTGGQMYNSAGAGDGFVVKYNNQNGNLIWGKLFGDSGQEISYGLAIDKNDNIYLGGSFTSPTFTVSPGNNNSILTRQGIGMYSEDAFLIKINTLGQYQWARSFGGSKTERLYSIATDDSGSVYIVGSFDEHISFDTAGVDTIYHITQGNVDIFVAKLDKEGGYRWSRIFGSAKNDQANCIYTDKDFNFYLTGQIGESTRFGTDRDSINNNPDYGLLTVNLHYPAQIVGNVFFCKYAQLPFVDTTAPPPTAFKDRPVFPGLKIYPNPANNYLIIEGVKEENIQYNLFSLAGLNVANGQLGKDRATITISHLPVGTYILNLSNEDKKDFSTKITKKE